MKKRLLELIEQIDKIEELFHLAEGAHGGLKIINDVQDFTIWLQAVRAELREIHGRTHDTFIFEAIHDLDGFNGWRDKLQFDKVKGDLLAIKDNIDKYYPQEKTSVNRTKTEGNKVMGKNPKIFISHSSKDKSYTDILIDLLEDMGLRENQIFCSSVPGCDIPLGKNIFDNILSQFHQNELHVIFVLSENFYNSPVCLNEMGAAWALSTESNFILLPGFDFSEIAGVIDRDNIGIKLDGDNTDVRNRLNQLKDNIIVEFGLPAINSARWESKRDAFINNVLSLARGVVVTARKTTLSHEAEEILSEVANSPREEMIITTTLQSGKSIQCGSKCHSQSEGQREFSKWDGAIDELIKIGFIKAIDKKHEVFKITREGYGYLDSIGEK